VDECKPLPPPPSSPGTFIKAAVPSAAVSSGDAAFTATGGVSDVTDSQGLTLVHLSAQPEPYLTRNTP